MSLPVPLRGDFDAKALRRLALASIYDGASRAKAAEAGGVGRRLFGIGWNALTHTARMDLSMGRRLVNRQF